MRYQITPEMMGYKKPNRVRIFIGSFAVTFVVWVLVTMAWLHRDAARVFELGNLAECIFVASGVAFSDAYLNRTPQGQDLEVNDDEIRVVAHSASWVGTRQAVRRIRKGNVQTIRERGGRIPGLFASERGSLGAFCFGGVLIPATLPDYSAIRTTILSWRRT
jgi:hypothetical protein